VDFKAMFSPIAKWAAEIRQTERIPEYVARAVHTARSGRPGPVVLALPEDMLSAKANVETIAAAPGAEPHPSASDMHSVSKALADAQRPVMVIGGPGWSPCVRDKVTQFSERLDLPVVAAFRYQDYMDNRHPNYAGHMGIGIDAALGKRIREADLLLVMGARLGEMTTGGYSLVKSPDPDQKIIHVHPGAEELGRVYRTDVPVLSSMAAFANRLADVEAPKDIAWADRTRQARADFEKFVEPRETPGAVKMEQIVSHVSESVADDAIITNGAGNYSAWVHRYFCYRGYKTQVANTAGAMGYAIPAAVSAKLAAPERTVVSFNGDGCFLMNGQELSTAVRYELPIVIIVANNGMYGTIRMHQEREYPSRVSGTDLQNPDFAAYARSFGANGETVEKTEDFPAVFDAALNSSKPSLIELKLDPEAITPTATLSGIRNKSA
jgi:acetolactate synthase-1/2/3 large subunit